MKKEQTEREKILEILRDVCKDDGSKKKKKRKRGKLTETDIDLFADEEKEE